MGTRRATLEKCPFSPYGRVPADLVLFEARSPSRLVKVTETRQVVYRAEKQACRALCEEEGTANADD